MLLSLMLRLIETLIKIEIIIILSRRDLFKIQKIIYRYLLFIY